MFELHYDVLIRTARLLVDDRATAEDVVMHAFISLHRRAHVLRDPNDAHRHLRSQVLSGARSRLRRRRVRRLLGRRTADEARTTGATEADGSDHAIVMQAIRSLSPRRREVLVMRLYLHMLESEVADELDTTLRSVRDLGARGLAAVGRALGVTRPDLEAVVRAILQQEADAMTVDADAGAPRLQRELLAQGHSRSLTIGVAAVLTALVIVWLWLPWPEKPSAPLRPLPTPTALATTLAFDRPYVVSVSTGAVAVVPKTLLPDGYVWGTTLAFTRSGDRVAVGTCGLTLLGCSGDSSLAIVSVDTGERAAVPVPDGQGVAGVSWTPGGRHLIHQLTEWPQGVGDLYAYDVMTGSSTKVTDIGLDAAYWWQLRWSATRNDTVLYDLPTDWRSTAGWNVWEAPIKGGAASIRLHDACAPEALPDGRLAYVVPRRGTWDGSAVAIAERDGSRRIVASAETGISHVTASPDGTRLAYPDAGRTWVVTLATGERRRAADGSVVQWIDDDTLLIVP
jgi:RNA polymerase sigma factor (sigma-70 family)